MKKKTVVIGGASRGIGAQMARRLAEDYNVVIFAKTAEPHPKLSGTIYTVAEEIKALGGNALALPVDVRFEAQVKNAMARAAEFGGGKIDALINNASAVFIKPTPKQVHLMKQVIVDGTRFCTEACLPYLLKSDSLCLSHVINIAPRFPMAEHWVEKYGPYAKAKRAIGKYTAMMEKKYPGIIFTTLWPKKMIYTSATIALFGKDEALKHTRSAEIMADAVVAILELQNTAFSGRAFLDEQALNWFCGINDFSPYLLSDTKMEDLYPDIFV